MADEYPCNLFSCPIQAPVQPEVQRTAPLYYNVRITPSIETQVLPVEDITEIESQSEVLPLLQILIMNVTYPAFMSKALCIGEDDYLIKSELIGTIFFASGICTLLQTTIGVRLPIVQGPSYMFEVAALAILRMDKWKCPDSCGPSNSTISDSVYASDNATSVEEIWKPRIRELQGAVMVASLFQVVIGFSGIMGAMMRFIGPLVIAPTVALTGITLFHGASEYAAKQWWIALVTIVLIAAFSQYTKNITIPCFRFERGVGCVKEGFPLFRLFPVVLAIAITWAIWAILTATHVFSIEDKQELGIINTAPWFRFPYPGQWGMPTVSAASAFGMLSGVLASMVEALSNYYACARMSQAPPPPMHAVNRGIGVEGIGSIIAGAFGSLRGTISYEENVGAIGITKAASLRVFQIGAILMMIFGVFTKLGTFFLIIPDPIIGGVLIVTYGMIIAVGIANLQFVDLNSSRNLFIIGFSFIFGLALPQYIAANPEIIKTGFSTLDQILSVLLQTSALVGGLAGFALDNTIPGTDHERGLINWREMRRHVDTQPPEVTSAEVVNEERVQAIYDIPLITPHMRRHRWTRFVPFLPTFDENLLSIGCSRRMRSHRTELDVV